MGDRRRAQSAKHPGVLRSRRPSGGTSAIGSHTSHSLYPSLVRPCICLYHTHTASAFTSKPPIWGWAPPGVQQSFLHSGSWGWDALEILLMVFFLYAWPLRPRRAPPSQLDGQHMFPRPIKDHCLCLSNAGWTNRKGQQSSSGTRAERRISPQRQSLRGSLRDESRFRSSLRGSFRGSPRDGSRLRGNFRGSHKGSLRGAQTTLRHRRISWE